MNTEVDDLKGLFRKAMRGFPSGVVIVTAADGRDCYAMTLTSIMSLSMEPASLVISVNRKASIYPAIERDAGFCVNILTREHRAISKVCSNSSLRDSRFGAGEFALKDGVPYLSDAQANLFCAQDGRYLYSTHALIIGRLQSAIVGDVVDPLLYMDGDYLSCASDGITREIRTCVSGADTRPAERV